MTAPPSVEYSLAQIALLLSGELASSGLPPSAEASAALIRQIIAAASGSEPAESGNFIIIEKKVLAAPAASMDFTGIPATYDHLLALTYLRSTDAAATINAIMRFNGDNNGNYDLQAMTRSASTSGGGESIATGSPLIGTIPGGGAGANLFGISTVKIQNYANTSNNKAFTAEWSNKIGTASGNLTVGVSSGFWRNNAAINRLTFLPGAGNLAIGSVISLYGVTS